MNSLSARLDRCYLSCKCWRICTYLQLSVISILMEGYNQGSNCEKWTGGVSNTVGTKKLGGLGGLQWNDQGNWGVKPPQPPRQFEPWIQFHSHFECQRNCYWRRWGIGKRWWKRRVWEWILERQVMWCRLRILENIHVVFAGWEFNDNSIFCVECHRWVHKRCSDISEKLKSNADYHCRRCLEGENGLFQSVLLKEVVIEPNVKLE